MGMRIAWQSANGPRARIWTERMDGWMDGWDGWTDGRMDEQTVVYGRVGIARERKYYVWTKSKCIHRRRPFRLTN